MRHHELAEAGTHPKQQKSVFIFGVLGVVNEETAFVIKGRLSFGERDAVLFEVCSAFARVPFEGEVGCIMSESNQVSTE